MDTWRTISRGLDEIEKVQENISNMLETHEDDHYKDTDLYNETVAWRAVLRFIKNAKQTRGGRPYYEYLWRTFICRSGQSDF